MFLCVKIASSQNPMNINEDLICLKMVVVCIQWRNVTERILNTLNCSPFFLIGKIIFVVYDWTGL